VIKTKFNIGLDLVFHGPTRAYFYGPN